MRINTRRSAAQRYRSGDSTLLFRRLDLPAIRRSWASSFDQKIAGAEVDEIIRLALVGWDGLTDTATGAPIPYAEKVKVTAWDPAKPEGAGEVELELSGVDLFIATADPADKQAFADHVRRESWKTIEKLEQEKNGSPGSSSGAGEPGANSPTAPETPAG